MKSGTPQLDRWRRSPESRELARRMCLEFNAQRHRKPKCGARRKRDGEPCQNLALENGRCRYHGGKVPKGDNWHVMQWPDGKAPDAVRRAEQKIANKKRLDKKRTIRIASMSPQERHSYEGWGKTHNPGSAGQRAQKRRDKAEATSLRSLRQKVEREPSPEELAFTKERGRLQAQLDEIKTLIKQNECLGVFG